MRAYNPTEDQTRKAIIDAELARAGWNVANNAEVKSEFEIAGAGRCRLSQDTPGFNAPGYSDYLLLDRHGDPLAVVEAKRTSRDPLAGRQQAEDYADGIMRQHKVAPFIFMTNGYEIWYWNRPHEGATLVPGFFSREDLERRRFQNNERLDLHSVAINTDIINRDYQFEALKRVFAELQSQHRKFLLVMATGTGKTRTAMALTDVLLRAKRAQRVLFLVDREALARQAFEQGFKAHLPAEARSWVRGGVIDGGARLYVATIQTMMECYHRVSPGFFDVIFADECHRSIYNKWRDVLSYFHAVQIGLTATPADFIDRDTFKYFGCAGKAPTFNYPYEDAVAEKHLVDFRPAYAAKTGYQIDGIRGNELPAEVQEQLRASGHDPDAIDFDGTDLEKKVTNAGTNEAWVREFMEVCVKDDGGVVPGKTIVFAVSHAHAKRLWETFNRLYPEYRGRLVEIIDSQMERPLTLLDKFTAEDYPRIAISVDMLDTGIDVREAVNLVFAKPVFSKIKFWQMIGRGTRRLDPDRPKPWCTLKERFLIIDFFDNFTRFGEKPEGEIAAPVDPLPVKIFTVRLAKLALFSRRGDAEHVAVVREELQAAIRALPANSVSIRERRRDIDLALSPAIWDDLDEKSFNILDEKIAPLLRFACDVNLSVAQFMLTVERLGLAVLQNETDAIAPLREAICDDIRRLPVNLGVVKQKETAIRRVLSPEFWDGLDHERCTFIKAEIAELMRYKQREEQEILKLDLDDLVSERGWIEFGPAGEGDYVAAYREKVEKRVRDLAAAHPVLQKLKTDQPTSDADIEALEATLNTPELYINEPNLRRAFAQPAATLVQLVKSILGAYKLPSPEDRVSEAFTAWTIERNAREPLNADQLNFLRAVKNVFAKKKHLEFYELFEAPFDQFGIDAAARLFAETELRELLDYLNRRAA